MASGFMQISPELTWRLFVDHTLNSTEIGKNVIKLVCAWRETSDTFILLLLNIFHIFIEKAYRDWNVERPRLTQY